MTAIDWRYTFGGTVLHAITDIPYMRSACGMWVWESCDWLGDGNAKERTRAGRLRPCRRCVAKVGA